MRSCRNSTLLLTLIVAVSFALTFPSCAQTANAVPEGTFQVAGTLVSKTDGHPLGGGRVILASVKARQNPQSVITSDDGKFEFTGVPAGKFSLAGAKRGFISAGYEQHDQYATAIVTGAGLDTENLVLKLSPLALIAGRVLDEAGEAVRNASLTLYRDNHLEGVHEIRTFRNARPTTLGITRSTASFRVPITCRSVRSPGTRFIPAVLPVRNPRSTLLWMCVTP